MWVHKVNTRTDVDCQRFSPNDLLRLETEDAFVSDTSSEHSWVREVLAETRTVVVRRGASTVRQIPVGVRGRSRSHRCAGFVPAQTVLETITPAHIVDKRLWRSHPRREKIPAIRHLESILSAWEPFGIIWGPTGSVGFELATGAPVASQESDLDISIRSEERISKELAWKLLSTVKSAELRLDIQIETPRGAVALVEYASQTSRILLRNNRGSLLVNDPWDEILPVEQKN